MVIGVWICLTIVTILSFATYVYLIVYRVSQERSIEKLLNKFYARPENPNVENPDVVARRDRILRLRQRLGVGIDSLPTVRFESTETDGDVENTGENDDTINAISDEEEMRARQRECLSIGVYLGPLDDYVDCRSYCGVTDGVDYRYYEKSSLILNGRKGRAGAYCVPNDAAACNTNTSLVLYTKHGWRCMPQTRAFAGEGGNLIVVCNGSLLDRATGKVWREHINPTLSFESVDEKLSDDGGHRFVCPPDLTDEIGNALIPAPFDRLLLLRNFCTMLLPHADTDKLRPNFATGRCECNDYVSSIDPSLGICMPYDTVDSVFKSDTFESAVRGSFAETADVCLETWTTLSDLDALTESESRNWRKLGIRPCGIERGDVNGDGGTGGTSFPACVRTYAMTFDRAVPSPYMMLDSSSLRDKK